jgi:hypothetical protein
LLILDLAAIAEEGFRLLTIEFKTAVSAAPAGRQTS